ncbi:unnamed protein product [Bursaphelenchus xylophilus]|uniref:(pine wood nematode) hypothetical protein n=1 Tax=Bursaphelenchus xylophilus TaxID=6326 RepID=A0A1I7RWZ9_BURXY|nr:unnamed protein product [Bursaphelenchus xylophilus]CAG9121232.1 unnamed protein product [Bursaphelenchus xylophilus]
MIPRVLLIFLSFSHFSPTNPLNIPFLSFFQPKNDTSQQLQCDCPITPPAIVHYDNKFQAETLEEAMKSFEDLLLLDEKKPPLQQEQRRTPEKDRACWQHLANKLKKVGLIKGAASLVQNNFINETCERYRFTRPNSDTFEYDEIDGSSSSSSEEDWEDKIKNKVGEKWQKVVGKFEKLKDKSLDSSEEKALKALLRHKRQAEDLIGTRYYLSCVNKGSSPDGSNGELLTLCTQCWAWRELPKNYLPRYLNELVCHGTDTECLAGYATCSTGTRTVGVVRNDSGTLTTVNIASATYCDCQIRAGTVLSSLVTASPTDAPIPGIPAAEAPAPDAV